MRLGWWIAAAALLGGACEGPSRGDTATRLSDARYSQFGDVRDERRAGGAQRSVEGTVATADSGSLLLVQPNSERLLLQVGSDTRVVLNGRRASLWQIPQGADVRASFSARGRSLILADVEVLGIQGSGAPPPLRESEGAEGMTRQGGQRGRR